MEGASALFFAFCLLGLFLLLGNVRAALLVTLTIPLSIALSGVFLKPAGAGINTMTLGGLAIAVGLLVDAAIIVTENVLERRARRRGESPDTVALEAAVEVGRPITYATLIVIAVFTPLFAMTGIEGRMYEPGAAEIVVGRSLLSYAVDAVHLVAVSRRVQPATGLAGRRGPPLDD